MDMMITFLASVVASLLGIALMVRLYAQGYSVWVRLYVAIMTCALMLVSYAATTGHRPIGYWPEATVAIGVMLGVIQAFTRSYQDAPSSERAGAFRSFF